MTGDAQRLSRLHDRLINVVVLLGFAAVAGSGLTSTLLLVGFPLGLAAAHLFYTAGKAREAHRRWWNTLVVVALGLSVFQYATNPALDIIYIGVQFVLVLTLIKLFSRQGPRDELQVYALSFLTLAAASEINNQFYYGLVFALYVITGTFALALFHLKTEATRHRAARQPSRSSPFDRLYVGVLAAISLLIFASSLFIYFAFPRVGLGLFSDPSRDSISVAGFDDEVQVGDHGTIRDNPSVVMRVDFQGEKPRNYAAYHWRARTFDYFDGTGWSQTLQDTRRTLVSTQSSDLEFVNEPALREGFEADDAERLEVQLEPLGTDVLPTLWPTERIELGDTDSSMLADLTAPELEYDAYGDLYHGAGGDVGMTYELTVQQPPDEQLLRTHSGRGLHPREQQRYLQVPDGSLRRLRQQAWEITDAADSNYEKAESVAAWMTAEFDYTTDLPRVEGDDPIEEFLFDHRRGHCEYFATAAVLLLRATHVPARMVNGFLGGTWNDVGGYLTVRHGDAHTWIEVFVPDFGWVPVDPTPEVDRPFAQRSMAVRVLDDTIDAMRHGWQRWFVDYDLTMQLSLLRDIGNSLAPRARLEESGSDDDGDRDDDSEPLVPLRWLFFAGGWLFLVGATFTKSRSARGDITLSGATAVAAATVAGAMWAGWFQGWTIGWMAAGAASVLAAAFVPVVLRARGRRDEPAEATRQFRRIERRAARSNLQRRPAEGPGDYLNRLADELPDTAPEVREFRRMYLALRFGKRRLDDRRMRQLSDLADAIVAALRDV